MSNLSDIEVGRLIEQVEQLAKTVTELRQEVTKLTNETNKGKGLLIGLFLSAAGMGAAASSAIHKWLGN